MEFDLRDLCRELTERLTKTRQLHGEGKSSREIAEVLNRDPDVNVDAEWVEGVLLPRT